MNEDFYLTTEYARGWSFDSPYQDLAVAVVEQAAKDYIAILQKMWKKDLTLQDKRALFSEKTGIERFFHSDWYEVLTDLNPDVVIKGCKQAAVRLQKRKIQERNKRRAYLLKRQMKNRNSEVMSTEVINYRTSAFEGGAYYEQEKA